ncbi:MAG: ATP-dependent helicase [Nitrospinae bacterium]|nr:ATP-dependent helicase [Nitrospinota bacterium]
MDDILSELNPSQKEAVTHGNDPLLIIAGAGTGKTTVITRRIAYLISSKIAKPEEILALTFTDKAASEMEERIDLLIPYGYANIWISTFHSFGDRILRENAIDLGLSPDFRLLTKPEQIIFFREHLFEFPLKYYRPLGDPTKHIEAIVTLISRAKDEDISPEEYIRYATQIEDRDEAGLQMELALAYKKYEELKVKYGFLDFGDQVKLPLRLLRERQKIREDYQRRFKYILVDEFQDTNYAQFQLVKLLAEGHRNITVVGDDDQSIYKFRGAAISNILGFKDTYPDARQIVLTNNYRSTQSILDSAYRLICHNNPDRLEVKNNVDKRLNSQLSTYNSQPSEKHLQFDTVSDEADGIAKMIESRIQRNSEFGIRNSELNPQSAFHNPQSFKDFAILVRSNNNADPFLKALSVKGIPHRFSGNRGLYKRDEIRLLIYFLRVITDFNDSANLYNLSASIIYQMNPVDLTLCLNIAHRRNRSLYEIFNNVIKKNEIPRLSLRGEAEAISKNEIPRFARNDSLMGEVSDEAMATIVKIIDGINKYVKMSTELSAGEVLYNFLMESGFIKNLTANLSVENEEKIENISRFFNVIRNSEDVLKQRRVWEFVRHLDSLIEAGDDPATAEADLDADAVNVMTVHKAKGLEFPVVFMVGLVDGRFPIPNRREPIPLPEPLIKEILPSGDFHLQEERRLFYVGITRAKQELYLTNARDYGGKRARKASRFVLETLDIPKVDTKAVKLSPLERIKNQGSGVRGQGSRKPCPLPLASCPSLVLSHYQIDDYLTCPLKYKYVHILRVPILQHHSIIYGKAIHEAIKEYNRKKLAGRSITVKELLSVFESTWSSEGFLTREHEEQRFESGKNALKLFYERQEASDNIPTLVEKDFSFPLGNNRVRGRWDRVDVKDGETIIIDFKSSDVREQKEADRRVKESLQLSIYALAYKEVYGKMPERVELHFLESGLVGRCEKDDDDLKETIEKIEMVADGIRQKIYEATPQYIACRYCAYSEICPYQ